MGDSAQDLGFLGTAGESRPLGSPEHHSGRTGAALLPSVTDLGPCPAPARLSHVRSESAEPPRAPASLPPPPPAPGHMEPLTRDGACRREAPSEAKAAKMNHSEEGHVSPARECENRRPGSLSDMKNKGERQGEVGAGQPDPAGLRVQGHKSKVPVTELGTARGRDGQGTLQEGG